MPEQLLGRIIKLSSNEGDLVLDPFAGSGTTLAVAKKLGRRCLGFDISANYVSQIRQRLKQVNVGDSLLGPVDPLLARLQRRKVAISTRRSDERDPTPPRSSEKSRTAFSPHVLSRSPDRDTVPTEGLQENRETFDRADGMV